MTSPSSPTTSTAPCRRIGWRCDAALGALSLHPLGAPRLVAAAQLRALLAPLPLPARRNSDVRRGHVSVAERCAVSCPTVTIELPLDEMPDPLRSPPPSRLRVHLVVWNTLCHHRFPFIDSTNPDARPSAGCSVIQSWCLRHNVTSGPADPRLPPAPRLCLCCTSRIALQRPSKPAAGP